LAIALSPEALYHESRKYIANIKKHATEAKKYRLNCLRITAAMGKCLTLGNPEQSATPIEVVKGRGRGNVDKQKYMINIKVRMNQRNTRSSM
jgi:hypothetical protein